PVSFLKSATSHRPPIRRWTDTPFDRCSGPPGPGRTMTSASQVPPSSSRIFSPPPLSMRLWVYRSRARDRPVSWVFQARMRRVVERFVLAGQRAAALAQDRDELLAHERPLLDVRLDVGRAAERALQAALREEVAGGDGQPLVVADGAAVV